MIQGREVWITGAASGLGRALAEEFLRRGARVLAIDRDARALELLKSSGPFETLVADVGAGADFVDALRGAVREHGRPAVFVNNAGIARVGGFLDTDPETFAAVLRVNLDGVIAGTRFALAEMEQAGGGLVINMASMAGHLPAPFMASYAASKFAVVGFTRALREELRLSGSLARVCLVCPGFVDTPIMSQPGAPFPPSLRWLVARPEPTARAIVRAALAGRAEIYPDFGARLMLWTQRLAPWLMRRAAGTLVDGSPALADARRRIS